MIATGKSISYGATKIQYDANKVIDGEKVASEFLRQNVYGDTPLEVLEEMQDIISNNKPNLKNGYLDIVITLSEEDEKRYHSDDAWRGMIDQFMHKLMMEKLGLTEAQYDSMQWIAYQHNHTDNNEHLRHWHILACRVLRDWTLITDSHIGRKTVDVANAISRQMQLSNAEEISKHNKGELRAIAFDVLKRMPDYSYAAFKEAMADQGVAIRDALNSKGELQGYYLTARSGTEYKASAIDRRLTLGRIEATHAMLRKEWLAELNSKYGCSSEIRSPSRHSYSHGSSYGSSSIPSFGGGINVPTGTTYTQPSGNRRRRGKDWDDMTDDEKRLASKGMSY